MNCRLLLAALFVACGSDVRAVSPPADPAEVAPLREPGAARARAQEESEANAAEIDRLLRARESETYAVMHCVKAVGGAEHILDLRAKDTQWWPPPKASCPRYTGRVGGRDFITSENVTIPADSESAEEWSCERMEQLDEIRAVRERALSGTHRLNGPSVYGPFGVWWEWQEPARQGPSLPTPYGRWDPCR